MNELEKAIAILGSQAKLARALGTSEANVSYWTKNGVPLRWAEQFEIATGGLITCVDIRPDFYSPEALVEAKRARVETLAAQNTPNTPRHDDPRCLADAA